MGKGIIIWIIVVVALVTLGVYFFYPPTSTFSSCAKAGEISFNGTTIESKDCCTDLSLISSASEKEYRDNYKEKGWFYEEEKLYPLPGSPSGFISPPDDAGFVCSDCGNGNCELWEHQYNCPKDCE